MSLPINPTPQFIERNFIVTKPTITRLFIGGAIAVIAGAILATAAIWIAIANDVFVMNGPDVVGLRGSALAWSLLAAGVVGGLTMLAGAVVGVVSSIGALLNTWQLENKSWFVVLLGLWIFSLGFIGMIAYILAGPDGTRHPSSLRAQAPTGATPA
jgi:hypothetical protein